MSDAPLQPGPQQVPDGPRPASGPDAHLRPVPPAWQNPPTAAPTGGGTTQPSTASARAFGIRSSSVPRPAPVPRGVPGRPTGAAAWALGLLCLAPIPFIAGIAAGLSMARWGRALRGFGGAPAENGRRAANWGLTYVLLTVVLLAGTIVCGALSSSVDGAGARTALATTSFALILVWGLVLGVLHLALSVIGALIARRGRVLRNPIAIPFLRAARDGADRDGGVRPRG